jgi:rSAM/selenodomain-associated transferase 1
MSAALAIFAKAPVAGQVKTRLCPPLTAEQAAKLYECFLLDTVARACSLTGVRVFLAITPVGTEPFRALLSFPVNYLPQRGATLGEREANVFADLLQQGFSRIVIIGSDIPTLPPAHLHAALACLEEPGNDVVIGPSDDGGYYLIGARAPHPTLFQDIAWSTPTVCAETLARARRAGLHVARVPSWHDVDNADDLRKLVLELNAAEPEPIAPYTQAYLACLKLEIETL